MKYTECDDLTLLRAWRGGDKRAGSQLLRRYLPTLRRFFVNKTNRDIEDLIQTTMLECVRSVDRYQERSQFKTYLLGIAYNVLLHHYRTCKRKHAPVEALKDSVAGLSTGLFTRFLRKSEQELVLRALRTIPIKLQTVFELFYWEQMTARECSIVLGIPEGTVKSHLRRGKELLKTGIEREREYGTPEQRDATVENLEDWIASIRASIPAAKSTAGESDDDDDDDD